MLRFPHVYIVFTLVLSLSGGIAMAQENTVRNRDAYIDAVTRGEGFMPWQNRESVSAEEREFRQRIEARKDSLLAAAGDVVHPVFMTREDLERIRRNIEVSEDSRRWFDALREKCDYLVQQDPSYVDHMIPALTPLSHYSFVCPNCIGRKSIEGSSESGIISWNWREPDQLRCQSCGQVYPSVDYPETATLVCPRREQTFTYYKNDRERANPENRTGDLSYTWGRWPVHPSFDGIIRGYKIRFMLGAAHDLAIVHALTGDERYGRMAARVLVRFAHCFRHEWLYIDYWDSVLDGDPLYAAWHDGNLPIEWKRHLCTSAYERDSLDAASMLQNYWGAGRVCPSTGCVSALAGVCEAYDLVYHAQNEDGTPFWNADRRGTVEKGLLLEWIMEAEPYMGGPGRADCYNNKAPRIYAAMAALARCLGIPEYADVALRGYEGIRDNSFGFDGFSHESPAYTNMYLGGLLIVPETLHGFVWPEGFSGKTGEVNLYRDDPMLHLMLRSLLDIRCPSGHLPTLSDTRRQDESASPASPILETGVRRFPGEFAESVRAIYRMHDATPTTYARMNLDADVFADTAGTDLHLPEVFFPAWMTAFLRHGTGETASMVVLPFNPPGGHRHNDNLALYYVDKGRTILGDHGYLSSSPTQRWIHDTFSHNLVIVDDERQRQGGDNPRRPRFEMMATSPQVSVAEGASDVYEQCGDYRRTAALIKGPDGHTFLVDIFRVAGGEKHDYRVFSELAASDAGLNDVTQGGHSEPPLQTSDGNGGRLTLNGLDMPQEEPLPDFGGSMEREHVFGLRNTRTDGNPPDAWQAVWEEPGSKYRLWMLSPCDTVQASNGPGQETWNDIGRRVRYVDAVNARNAADTLCSVFVAVHEPDTDGAFVIREAVRLPLPAEAGPDAVALRIDTEWGVYRVFSDVEQEVEADGVRFSGKFGVVCTAPDEPRWLFSCGASTVQTGDLGFRNEPAEWSAETDEQTGDTLRCAVPRPAGWPELPEGCESYVGVETDGVFTGFPVESLHSDRIVVKRFPLQPAARFRLHAVRFERE